MEDKLNKELDLLENQIRSAQRKKSQCNEIFYDSFKNLNNLQYIFDTLDVKKNIYRNWVQ